MGASQAHIGNRALLQELLSKYPFIVEPILLVPVLCAELPQPMARPSAMLDPSFPLFSSRTASYQPLRPRKRSTYKRIL